MSVEGVITDRATCVKGAAIAASTEAALNKVMLRREEQEKPRWEQVNMEKRMQELKLDAFHPPETWPPHNALRELATRIKTMAKDADDKSWIPFVAAELKRFLPDCFPEHVVTLLPIEKTPRVATWPCKKPKSPLGGWICRRGRLLGIPVPWEWRCWDRCPSATPCCIRSTS